MNTSDSRRHDICSKSCPKRRARHCGRKKSEILKQQDRLQKIPPQLREQELDELVIQSLARNEVPPYEKWCLRQRTQQAMLPFCVSPERWFCLSRARAPESVILQREVCKVLDGVLLWL